MKDKKNKWFIYTTALSSSGIIYYFSNSRWSINPSDMTLYDKKPINLPSHFRTKEL